MEDLVITEKKIIIPFYDSCISAGFPSPAQDYVEKEINVHDLLVQHPLATFLIRVKGLSMINAFIPEDALLLVDKSLKPKHKDIIVGVVDGEFTVKYLFKRGNTVMLQPANPTFKSIEITEEMDFTVWGAVSTIIIERKHIPYAGIS